MPHLVWRLFAVAGVAGDFAGDGVLHFVGAVGMEFGDHPAEGDADHVAVVEFRAGGGG